jgi:pyridoxine 4-dehydrogenase
MDPEIQQVFDLCVDKGVTLFDTGDSYGTGKLNGQAEKLLGKFMRDYAAKNGGKRPYVGTKFATYPWRLTADSLVNACKESSARLERPVDIGQIHWPAANYAPWQERALWDGLVKMYKEARTAENLYSTHSPLYLKHV